MIGSDFDKGRSFTHVKNELLVVIRAGIDVELLNIEAKSFFLELAKLLEDLTIIVHTVLRIYMVSFYLFLTLAR